MNTTNKSIMPLNISLDALGYENSWKAIIYYEKVKASWLAAQEENRVPHGAQMDNWVFVAAMHEIMHSVGVNHLRDSGAIDVMRSTGTFEWGFRRYDLSKSTKDFLKGFGLK